MSSILLKINSLKKREEDNLNFGTKPKCIQIWLWAEYINKNNSPDYRIKFVIISVLIQIIKENGAFWVRERLWAKRRSGHLQGIQSKA